MRVPVKSHASLLLGEFSSQNQVFFRYYESKMASFLKLEAFHPFFKHCANFQLVKEGTLAHADAIKTGFDSYTSAGNSIMSFYLKLGMKGCARNVFDEMLWKDSVSWNALIHGFLSQGDSRLGLCLFIEAKACGFVPNLSTLVLVLQACWKLKAVTEGQCFHGFIVKSGFSSYISLQNSLVSFYGKCNNVESAQKLFDEISERDVISWSSLISGYVQTGGAVNALQLFRKMSMEDGIEMDGLVLVSVLQACSFVGDVNYGRSVHGHVFQRGFEADLFINNSLIDMYSKCFHMNSAYMVFIQMAQTNLVSWNSILSGLVENDKYMEALLLLESMKKAAVEGDAYTAVILLQACKMLGLEAFCRSIHALIIRRLFELNNFVMNSLLDAYAKCELMELTLRLFRQMRSRDVVSWSTMISGFSHCGEPHKAVAFFIQMRLGRHGLNSVTLLSLLEACSTLADLKLSKCVHGVAARSSFSHNLSVATALLDAYAKCGSLNSSRKIFRGMTEKNLLSWNAMIAALGMNGCAREALAALEEMTVQNVKPNGVTMLSILSACSHGGLVQEGLLLFQRMSEDFYDLKPRMEHYSCIVDMLARAGDVVGGFEVIKRMSEEGVEAAPAAWGALLSACRRFGDREIGENVASHVLELEPLRSAGYVLSSSMYAMAGLQDETARLRLLMKEKGVRVVSGYSLVHAKRFLSWDESHLMTEEIYSMVDLLHDCIKWPNDET
ncbi:pentatricopeptide repeat-containing protein At2g17210 [Dendrobium catenatum]|uniref:Pentatricopeptide repeat-containing protein n=1 Tax=Dendrobium catenatum TaxID=906689 RepID=A0A2I0WE25_9ASPA|nr:pentatricopeptide repeat-containing protein At2g17210 [Dendrobium catenatum]PKU73914.1 Pentatricopeptide repeat-containing protein [Dendrobium catenatum]